MKLIFLSIAILASIQSEARSRDQWTQYGAGITQVDCRPINAALVEHIYWQLNTEGMQSWLKMDNPKFANESVRKMYVAAKDAQAMTKEDYVAMFIKSNSPEACEQQIKKLDELKIILSF